MEDIKLNVRALAANLKISVAELAIRCGIEPEHLKNVSAGRVKMTSEDLIKLSKYTGVNPYNISTE